MSDSDDESPARPPLPQPLRRARAGRWLGGVCQGFAARWGIPVVQVRALFLIAVVLAGFGLLAYLACWLVLPPEDEPEGASALRALASLALLAAACAGLATLAAAAGLATLFGFGWTVLVALGVFLAGALVAWPLVRPAWVLLPLVAVAIPAVAVAASGVRIDAQAGLVVVAPETPDEIPAAGYRAGLGDLLVDLRKLDAEPDERVDLRLRTGIGRTVVALPHDRCFDLEVSYRMGHAGADFVRGILSRTDWRWHKTSLEAPIFYGTSWAPGRGHWRRESSDPHAPLLRIDFASVDGELWLRDYPASTGPIGEPSWPDNVIRPASPGDRRWAWRKEVRRPAVQRRWRAWERRMVAFDRHLKQLHAGACKREVPR
jgi:phage shock protein PspC (stress-responsive transcriptional regulator)